MRIKLRYVINIIFLLSISTTIVALPDLFFPIKIPYKEFFITPLLEVFFIGFIAYKYSIKIKNLLYYIIFIFPIFFLYLFEPFRFFILEGRNVVYILINFFNISIFFIFYLVNININKDFFINSLKVYWKFNYFIALFSIFVFILLLLDLTSLHSWGLPSFFSDNFHRKLLMENAPSDRYSIPFYLTVILTDYVKPFGVFSQFGSFAGLSYESHLATYFMTPAFFLTFYFYKKSFKNFIKYASPFIVFFLLSASLTNIISLLIVSLFMFIMRMSIKKIIFASFTIATVSILLFMLKDVYMDTYNFIINYIDYKFNSRSNEESSGFLKYILSPNSLIGWGVFNIPTYFTKNHFDDIGFISSFFTVLFFIQLLYLSLKNIFCKNYIFGAIGLYILVHSMKFPLHIFLYPYIIFIIIMLSHQLVENKSKSRILK